MCRVKAWDEEGGKRPLGDAETSKKAWLPPAEGGPRLDQRWEGRQQTGIHSWTVYCSGDKNLLIDTKSKMMK